METLKSFWSELGWLSNFLTIALALGTISGIFLKVKKLTKRLKEEFKNFGDMESFAAEKIDESKSIKSKKIAIVDDQPENYPLDFLQKSGFNTTSITSISLTQYKYLLDYDLIILDVTNIVREDMKRGGLELMKRLKQDSPRKPIIAASSKTYDPTLTEFFRLSDKQIQTPIKDQALESVITKILEEFYSPIMKAKEIDEMLSGKGLDQDQKFKILKLGYKYIEDKIKKDKLMESCSRITHKIDTHKYSVLLDHLRETM